LATRVYFPSTGSAAVTPSTWNFGAQINPVTLPGSRTKTATALTTKLEATGVTNPTARAMMRFVYGPLEGQSISGTVKGQMLGLESNAGANASLALAIKIIQPDGTDRAVLLAQTAGDSAAAGVELATGSLTNARFLDASEANPTLSTQTATRGDYLVIEIGFRSATGTTRNISLRYGDTGSTDLTDGDTSSTTDNVPWIEFTDDIAFLDRTPGVAATTLTGLAPSLAFGFALGAGALGLTGASMGVAFPGAETGALALSGHAPTVSTGGGTSITPDAGTLTLSGQAPTLRYDFVIDVPAAELALSGLSPTVSVDVGRPVPVGALTLTGETPTLSVVSNGVIEVPVGSLSLAGQSMGVAFHGPEIGALVLAGQTPTLSISSGETIAVPVGALTLSGQAPNRVVNHIAAPGVCALTFEGTFVTVAFIDPDPGQLNLLGYAPTLAIGGGGTNTDIAVPVGALTLTGQAPALQFDIRRDPDAGALTLNGLAPTLLTNIGRETGVGALALSGLAPNASLGINIGVPAGALTLTGYTPPLGGQTLAEPGVGSLTLAGQAPTLRYDFVIDVPVGALTLSGQAPNLKTDFVIGVPVGALTMSGEAGTLSTDVGRSVPVGSLTLSGVAPTLSTGVGREPISGTLTLTGLAPSLRYDLVIAVPAGSLVLAGVAPSAAIWSPEVVEVGDTSVVVLLPVRTVVAITSKRTTRSLTPVRSSLSLEE
jgi:hypothetical protein